MYYNTNNLQGSELIQANQKTLSQEEKILAFYKKFKGHKMSPDFVWIKLFKKSVPITSVRRAITDLTSKGYLLKTDSKCIGIYQSPVSRWTLV